MGGGSSKAKKVAAVGEDAVAVLPSGTSPGAAKEEVAAAFKRGAREREREAFVERHVAAARVCALCERDIKPASAIAPRDIALDKCTRNIA